MRILISSVLCMVILGNLVTNVYAQFDYQATCGLLGVGTFLISDQILCEEEKEDELFDLAGKLCRTRPFDSQESCLRCIQNRKDEEECNSDFGPNGVDDAVAGMDNDDCAYDEEFKFCLDEHA